MLRSIIGLAVVLGLLGGALPDASAQPCTPPEPPSLPLRDEPRTRIVVNRYLDDVKAYFACAGEQADPAVRADYARVVTAWTKLVTIWGNRHRR